MSDMPGMSSSFLEMWIRRVSRRRKHGPPPPASFPHLPLLPLLPPSLSICSCNVCHSYTVDLMHNVGSLYENGTDFNPADEWAAKYQVKEERNATIFLTSHPEEGCVSLHFAGMKLNHGFLVFSSRSLIALKSLFVYLMELFIVTIHQA
mmetsp:Transcript_12609/g.44025  ORF Transcript_12609/g.44025 Transcript_12609/m.44025 type:complete len:149 (-) Transcript_12609:113-559(-)